MICDSLSSPTANTRVSVPLFLTSMTTYIVILQVTTKTLASVSTRSSIIWYETLPFPWVFSTGCLTLHQLPRRPLREHTRHAIAAVPLSLGQPAKLMQKRITRGSRHSLRTIQSVSRRKARLKDGSLGRRSAARKSTETKRILIGHTMRRPSSSVLHENQMESLRMQLPRSICSMYESASTASFANAV